MRLFAVLHPARSFEMVVLSCLFWAAAGHAQGPSPLANPNLELLTNGRVFAITQLPDGSVVFGGAFTSVNGTPRSNVAKLSPNGVLDATWNPSADSWVYALASDVSGNVYVGGIFGDIGGQSRSRIAKLSGTGIGAADALWDPSASYEVYALSIDAAGNVYVGGYFNRIGGQFRDNLAKLSGTGVGAADTTWNPSPDNGVIAIAIDVGGNIYVGGGFTNIGGQTRNYIAKLSSTGTGAADSTWNPSADKYVAAVATDISGNVYAGGNFANIGGQTRSHIAKLLGTNAGLADASWNPSADNNVLALATDINGNV